MQKDKKKTPPKNQPIHLLGLVSEVQNIIVSLSRAQQYKMLDKDTAQCTEPDSLICSSHVINEKKKNRTFVHTAHIRPLSYTKIVQ